jgi:hypothetical protein
VQGAPARSVARVYVAEAGEAGPVADALDARLSVPCTRLPMDLAVAAALER